MSNPHRSAAFASRRRAGGAIAAAAIALLGIAGCGGSDSSPVLAHVGDQAVRLDDFEALAPNAASRYPMPPEQAKAALLDDLIRRQLMLTAATQLHLVPDSLIAARRRQLDQQVLGTALLQSIEVRNPGVSDAEVRALYDARRTSAHVQVIVTPDEPSARGAQQLLRSGMDFGVVAKRYDVGGILPAGGDLGFIQSGQLVDPLDGIVSRAPIGRIEGPVPAGDSWFLVRVLERRPAPEGSLAAETPQLRQLLEQRKQRMFVISRYDRLRDAYGIQTDPNGIDVFFTLLGGAALAPGAPPPALTAAQRAVVVGRWDGGPGYRGTYTLGEAYDDLMSGHSQGLNPRIQPAIEQWVRSQILQRITVVEARRRHLDDDPAIARRLREQLNDEVLGVLYNQAIAAHATPTPDEIHAAFARVSGQLEQLHSVQLQTATLPDSATAVRTAMQTNGRHLKDVAAELRLTVKEQRVTFPTPDSLWLQVERGFQSQPVGAYFGPFHTAGGWMIAEMVGRDASAPAFESLPADVQQQLTQQAGDAARERRLLAYTDSLRAAIPVTIDREELRKAHWPRFGFTMMPPG